MEGISSQSKESVILIPLNINSSSIFYSPVSPAPVVRCFSETRFFKNQRIIFSLDVVITAFPPLPRQRRNSLLGAFDSPVMTDGSAVLKLSVFLVFSEEKLDVSHQDGENKSSI